MNDVGIVDPAQRRCQPETRDHFGDQVNAFKTP
jgi:hypothetical protein